MQEDIISNRPVFVPVPRPKLPEKCNECLCPVCRGLECLERPRFFAGQLLTEAELNSEQAYFLAKNRLHNRYLHGWGVVCGLQVVCHDCEGWVRVMAGYALDPCGNDIIVCKDAKFNVAEEINKCIEACRRRDDECAPWRDPNDDCREDEQHWCITLEYRETETRAVMPLQEKKSHCGCGSKGKCGCGGEAKKCSCETPKQTTRPTACEATRILEQYRLGVVPEPDACKTRRRLLADRRIDVNAVTAASDPIATLNLGTLTPDFLKNPMVPALLAAAPDGGILDKVMRAAQTIVTFLRSRFTQAELDYLASAARVCARKDDPNRPPATGAAAPPSDAVSLVDLCCRFRHAVKDLYLDNPLNVRCVPFDCPPCRPPQPPPPPTPPTPGITVPPPAAAPAPANDLQETFCCLIDALVNYFIDAVCMAILPPCPPDPCDDRLIIACVTIEKGKIIRICNHACRRYAGSFNSLEYWSSAVPILPLIGTLLRELCCGPGGLQWLMQLQRGFGQLRASIRT